MRPFDKNTRLLLMLAGFVAFMVIVAYASVPLYSLFCKVTGFGGTPGQVTVAPTETRERWVNVTLDSNVDSALPWEFKPETRTVRAKLGEVVNVKYRARNNGSKTVVGTATYNVQPDKVGAYFDKIECFCFTKQPLKAGEEIELPVQFFIDPSLADDHKNDDVQNITLSYTFFLAKDQQAVVTKP